jgi:D-proline reductase (dithiol) PrdB
MAQLSDLSWKYQLFFKAYRFRKIEPSPWTPLKKPLAECRLGLVTTAAFYDPAGVPFDEEEKGGDSSFRLLPQEPALLQNLKIGHRSDAFDPQGIERDENLALPWKAALNLVQEKFIGSLNTQHLSFMGSITAPLRLIQKTAPEAAEIFKKDQVDIAFFTPV